MLTPSKHIQVPTLKLFISLFCFFIYFIVASVLVLFCISFVLIIVLITCPCTRPLCVLLHQNNKLTTISVIYWPNQTQSILLVQTYNCQGHICKFIQFKQKKKKKVLLSVRDITIKYSSSSNNKKNVLFFVLINRDIIVNLYQFHFLSSHFSSQPNK